MYANGQEMTGIIRIMRGEEAYVIYYPDSQDLEGRYPIDLGQKNINKLIPNCTHSYTHRLASSLLVIKKTSSDSCWEHKLRPTAKCQVVIMSMQEISIIFLTFGDHVTLQKEGRRILGARGIEDTTGSQFTKSNSMADRD